MTDWINRILNSNAGRNNPEAALRLIEQAGGDLSAAKGSFPAPSSHSGLPPADDDEGE